MLDLIWVVLPYIDVYTLSSFCQRHSFFLAFLFPFLQNARDYENNSNLRSESKYFPNVNEDHKVLCSETQMQFRIGHREIRGGPFTAIYPLTFLTCSTLQPFNPLSCHFKDTFSLRLGFSIRKIFMILTPSSTSRTRIGFFFTFTSREQFLFRQLH